MGGGGRESMSTQQGREPALGFLRRLQGQIEFIHHTDEFGNRTGLHLPHQIAAVRGLAGENLVEGARN